MYRFAQVKTSLVSGYHKAILYILADMRSCIKCYSVRATSQSVTENYIAGFTPRLDRGEYLCQETFIRLLKASTCAWVKTCIAVYKAMNWSLYFSTFLGRYDKYRYSLVTLTKPE